MNSNTQNISIHKPLLPHQTKIQLADRKFRDKYNAFTPLILILLNAFVFGISLFYINKLKLLNDQKELYLMFLHISAGVLVGLIHLPLYFLLIIALKNYLVNISITLILLITHISASLVLSTVSNLTCLIVFGLLVLITYTYLYYYVKHFKLASLTSKNFLSLVRQNKAMCLLGLFKAIFPILAILLLALLSIISVFIFFVLDGFFTESNPWTIFLFIYFFIFIFNLYFFIKLVGSLSYLYGAATFDQYSHIRADGSKLNKPLSKDLEGSFIVQDSDGYIRDAYTIAFYKSFGSACFETLSVGTSAIERAYKRENGRDLWTLTIDPRGILRYLRNPSSHISSSALLYSALYGEPIVNCGKAALESFIESGYRRLLDVWLIGSILDFLAFVFFGCVGFGVNMFLFSLMTTDSKYPKFNECSVFFFFNFGMICAYVATKMVNAYISGGANVQIPIFVEDPRRLEGSINNIDELDVSMEKYYYKD